MLLDWALPPRCAACGEIVAGDDALCLTCWSSLSFLGPPACACCDRPFASAQGDGALCGSCIAQPPPWDRARAAVLYGDIARTLVMRFKYGRRVALSQLLARLMRARLAEALNEQPEALPLLIPVPLHRRRFWWRGFNQSALLAQRLAADGRAHWLPDALLRTRATKPLRGLGRKDRAKAVRGAFAINPRHAAKLTGAHVILIDDVWTSGATAHACCQQLRKAGAGRVELLVFARVLAESEGGADGGPSMGAD